MAEPVQTPKPDFSSLGDLAEQAGSRGASTASSIASEADRRPGLPRVVTNGRKPVLLAQESGASTGGGAAMPPKPRFDGLGDAFSGSATTTPKPEPAPAVATPAPAATTAPAASAATVSVDPTKEYNITANKIGANPWLSDAGKQITQTMSVADLAKGLDTLLGGDSGAPTALYFTGLSKVAGTIGSEQTGDLLGPNARISLNNLAALKDAQVLVQQDPGSYPNFSKRMGSFNKMLDRYEGSVEKALTAKYANNEAVGYATLGGATVTEALVSLADIAPQAGSGTTTSRPASTTTASQPAAATNPPQTGTTNVPSGNFDMAFSQMGRHFNTSSPLWGSQFSTSQRTVGQTANLLTEMNTRLPNSRNTYLKLLAGPLGAGKRFSGADQAKVANTLQAMRHAVNSGLVTDGTIVNGVNSAIAAFERTNSTTLSAAMQSGVTQGATTSTQGAIKATPLTTEQNTAIYNEIKTNMTDIVVQEVLKDEAKLKQFIDNFKHYTTGIENPELRAQGEGYVKSVVDAMAKISRENFTTNPPYAANMLQLADELSKILPKEAAKPSTQNTNTQSSTTKPRTQSSAPPKAVPFEVGQPIRVNGQEVVLPNGRPLLTGDVVDDYGNGSIVVYRKGKQIYSNLPKVQIGRGGRTSRNQRPLRNATSNVNDLKSLVNSSRSLLKALGINTN